MTDKAIFQAHATNNVGNVLPAAQVTVTRESNGLLEQLYSDRAGVTPIGNPISADAAGFFKFHCAGGAFRIDYELGAISHQDRYVAIGTAGEFDAEELLEAAQPTYATPTEAIAGTEAAKVVAPASLFFPQGHLFGLDIANAVGDPANDITVGAGSARNHDHTENLVLPASITKRLDAAWVVGNNQGGLDVGSTMTASSWYYGYLIKRVDTGVVDVIFSLNASAPTLPTNYTKYRRIPGAIRTTSVPAIYAFTQADMDTIFWTVTLEDAEATISAATLVTVTVPPSMRGLFRFSTRTAAAFFVVQPVSETSATPSATAPPGQSSGVGTIAGELEVQVNASSQIRVVPDAASRAYSLYSRGFRDMRWRRAL